MRLLSVLGALSLVFAACGGSQDVLLTPQERATYASTNTVALAPVNLVAQERPPSLITASDYIERVLTQRLERSGFRVIAPDDTRAIYDTLALNTQNKFDATTGEPNPSVMAGLKAAFARRMAERHGADAVLFPDVILVRARIDGATAEWDRAREPVPQGLIDETAASESNRAGSLLALSLRVELVTRDGKTLYEDRAGLEYLGPLKRSQRTPVLFRGQAEKEGMLQEPTRVERAVPTALDLLAQKKAAAGTAEVGR